MKDLGKYFNRKWSCYDHKLEIQVVMFEDEAGNEYPGLRGTMDGEVQQHTINKFRADSDAYQFIKSRLEIYATIHR